MQICAKKLLAVPVPKGGYRMVYGNDHATTLPTVDTF